ncbi:hypothetical protein CVT24_005881 [Panaeolus cyanescens]|uniref:BTB domain-containing protein n=1 Tax=Panaeolus cyanescens TaxID=181874 RepID=A0A409YEZ7_9AGAR|nr:hypothetical protein CVT24_005881 [Panaeolus cyanescens]
MTLLHDYFNTRNLQAFQRLLDGSADRGTSANGGMSSTPTGSSYNAPGGGGRSWNRPSAMTSSFQVNAKDWLGRTALHLACSSLESIEYTRALLKHPNIDVNLSDSESHWTPLHRALYAANLPAALLLLQRNDIDASAKDLEGYTAFDLYNSTVNATKPDAGATTTELYTWGVNMNPRNATLGTGDENDRSHAENTMFKPKEAPEIVAAKPLVQRLTPLQVRDVQMSKLHTVVVTSEAEGNLRLCGFGSGGRLGPGSHTQYALNPLPGFTQTVLRVALGQDHTLVLTKSGEVYSWGLNRFSQLGYVVEVSGTSMGRHEEPIQNTPKRVVGLLRKEIVRGIAASRIASACWTNETLFTWGKNMGQLGYDKNAQPIQVLPRPVTKFSHPVIDVSMSDTVLVALLVTHHVECIWNDRQCKISFPMHAFPTGIQPYRPPQSIKDAGISKVTCCNDSFAALSFNGEVFTFSAPVTSPEGAYDSRTGPLFKPQRVWALRKKFSAVRDVALGTDGSIIICTESGHVFVRTRNVTKGQAFSGKSFKFERVPYLQRVVRVCANSTGGFGAVKVNYTPKPIVVKGNFIAQDLKNVQPYLHYYRSKEEKELADLSVDAGLDLDLGLVSPGRKTPRTGVRTRSHSVGDLAMSLHYDDEPDVGIEQDISSFMELSDVLVSESRVRKASGGHVAYNGSRLPFDADTLLQLHPSSVILPVHSVILASRSKVLQGLLSSQKPIQDSRHPISLQFLPSKPGPGFGVGTVTCLQVKGCHPLTMLIFLRYLYSDELIAVWDRRIGSAPMVDTQLAIHGIGSNRIKEELQHLASMFELPALTYALEPPVKREPAPTMTEDLHWLFNGAQSSQSRKGLPAALQPDVIIQLKDKDVYTHSVVLRARSPLLADFFQLEDWTIKRWTAHNTVSLDLRHLKWHPMQFVIEFLCCGGDEDMFYKLDFINTVDDLLTFMFDVLAGANELLLDRLILLCSSVILNFTSISNACFVLSDATYYHSPQLMERLQNFMAVNLESLLESRLLDDIPYALVKQLSRYIKERQTEKSPFSRSDIFVNEMLIKHADWLKDIDIPQTIVRTVNAASFRRDPSGAGNLKISPPAPARTPQRPSHAKEVVIISSSPMLRRPPSDDDIFMMDEPETPAEVLGSTPTPSPAPLPRPMWKPQSSQRVDMKAVMAEAATMSHASSSRQQKPNQGTTGSSTTPSRTPSFDPSRPPYPFDGSGTPTKGTSRSSGPAWRSTSTTTPGSSSAFPALSSTPPTQSSMSQARDSPRPTLPLRTPHSVPAPATPDRQPSAPGLGPVINPSKQPKPSSTRSVSGGKAWTQPPVEPVVVRSTAHAGSSSGAVSFLDIQQSQQSQHATPTKDKRSLREIQEEEASLQAEADFLKWWTAEEERLKQEQEALERFQESLNRPSGGGGQPGAGGKKRGQGQRGRPPKEGKGKQQQQQQHGSGPSQVATEANTSTATQERTDTGPKPPRRHPRKPKPIPPKGPANT